MNPLIPIMGLLALSPAPTATIAQTKFSKAVHKRLGEPRMPAHCSDFGAIGAVYFRCSEGTLRHGTVIGRVYKNNGKVVLGR